MEEALNGVLPEAAAPEATPAAEPASIEQPTAEQPETEGVKAETAEPQPEAKVEKPVQSKEDNAAAAAARRRAEQEARNKFDGDEDLLLALKDIGYQGTRKEIARLIRAQKEGVTVDVIKRREEEAEAIRKRAIEEAPEIKEAQKIIVENRLKEDLQKVKEAHPEVTAQNARELGDIFCNLMATGTVDPVTAYEAQLAHTKRNTKPVPPSTGAVKSDAAGPSEKEFYTPDEVDRLSQKDLDNPKILDRVMRSMTRWGK